jgi:hypothetical protein
VPSADALMAGLAVIALYQAGQKAKAIDAFERGVIGPDYRANPRGADTRRIRTGGRRRGHVFAQELPMLQQWQLAREDATRIRQPVLVVMGAESPTIWSGFKECYDLLCDWLPSAEGFVLPAAPHDSKCRTRAASRRPFRGSWCDTRYLVPVEVASGESLCGIWQHAQPACLNTVSELATCGTSRERLT